MAQRGTLDLEGDRSTDVDRVERGPSDRGSQHVRKSGRYNSYDSIARIASQPSDRDPRGGNQAFL